MTAPISLPRLAEGENRMELKFGDKYGLCTVPWQEVVDFRQGADLPRRWAEAANAQAMSGASGWQKIAPAEQGKPVQVTFRFDAPWGRKFAWAYVVAMVLEGPPNEPAGNATLEWSPDGQEWQLLTERAIANTDAQWDMTIDGEFRVEQGAETVWIRLTSDTGICGVEFYGHLCEQKRDSHPLEITHSWKQGDGEGRFNAPAGATTYTIECGKAAHSHTIEMHVPSVRSK